MQRIDEGELMFYRLCRHKRYKTLLDIDCRNINKSNVDMWESPLYSLKDHRGKPVVIDVTSSAQPGLPHNDAINGFVELLQEKEAKRIVDFGAGSLRHTFPLLEKGFQVCAVEFEEQYKRPACRQARQDAQDHPNFSSLIWPGGFKKDNRRFDAALLCYVLQTMPVPKERKSVLRLLKKKLRDDAYLLWMSRYNQIDDASRSNRVSDGIYRWKEREHQTFYREFTTEETHEMFEDEGFKHIRSLGIRGTEQIFAYAKGNATWI
jgi:hypothetical protein